MLNERMTRRTIVLWRDKDGWLMKLGRERNERKRKGLWIFE
jgi:hypothetical protein